MKKFGKVIVILVIGCVIVTPASEAGGLGKAVSKAAIGKLLKRDGARDGATLAKPLTKDRKVWRYNTAKRAKTESRKGLAPGRHTTSKIHPGRPPSAAVAKKRYGLPQKPQVRQTIILPKGQKVRSNKVLGGEPGRGELTSTKRVKPKAIVKVVPLN